MTVRVEYLAQLRDVAKRDREEHALAGEATLIALLEAIAQRHGDEMRRLLFHANGNPRASILVFVNGRHAGCTEPVTLPDGGEVVLSTPISGGRV